MSNPPKTTISTDDAMAMMAQCFNVATSTLHPALEREAIPDWDSMGALMLIAELDERFGIELTADVSREMKRIGDVLDFLRAHGALRDTA
ncbi:MAG: acyl carrier protein [Hydrogenophaga sp.]|uniref:acyl carrier protein n=1 Tax=Hydrogenophaga sp. TaxID=1904254 RepID=UPI001DE89962|nr:acyl carrier protein [Hydrogenophaga sp.]MBX3608533.1 acyl carrier protein [Hydrogenophaga sp.]